MTAEIEKIFTATAKSTWHFLIENGQGCYIPAYQRAYSWDDENISRLLEDVTHGIEQLATRHDTISFLGTIIAIHDTRYRTVDPLYVTEVAPRVMTIIDGQQRICTVIMSNMVLHDFIRRLSSRFEGKTEPHLFWINDHCKQLLADLRNSYLIDRSSGDGSYRFYPRVIRAYFDAWSRRGGQAKYQSPIARLVWEYIDHSESGKKEPYKFNPVDAKGKLVDLHKTVHDAFKFLQLEVGRICQKTSKQYDLPDLVSATQNVDFSKSIWGYALPAEVSKYVAEQSGDPHYADFCTLMRAIILAKYLNNRVAITIVTTDSEDDAFDMFEALNTTGEPLTAFETFKPKVIDAEGLSKYEQSPSHKWMAEIESYLERFRKADDKQRATSEMLVPFALAETGDKLRKKLNDQRRYLRDQFDALLRLGDLDKNRSFVRALAGIASFMRSGWDVDKGEKPTFDPLNIDDEDALVGLEALRGLKHSITIAPLSRFYQHAVDGSVGKERDQRTLEFTAALKATVAFSVLWRGAMGGTENIDSYYRDIMRSGITLGGETVPPLAHRPNGKTGALSIANYKKALKLILQHKGKVATKEDWVKLLGRSGVYQYSATLARFLLFCASDDAIPDKGESGLIQRGRLGISPMLTLAQWHDESYFTVEHIAPQSSAAGWDPDIFKEPRTVHLLGNLTLLPKEENNLLASRPWEHKKLMYALLSSETKEEFEKLLKALGAVGLTLSKSAADVLNNARHLGLCRSVATYDQPWRLQIIEKRTQRFAELAWDRLAPWLFS